MILSKFYNRHKEKVNELSGASKKDPRVITPSNIPIFILPTRLEEINPQTTKTILRDSFEENSLPENNFREVNDAKGSKHKLSIDYKNSSAISSRSNSKVSTVSYPENNRLKIQQNNAHISSSMQNLKSNQTTITTTTKTIIKTLFRNGLLNMPTENIQDEKKFKENYCDLWVLHGDSDSVKNTRNHTNESSKRASFNDVIGNPDISNYLSKSTSILNKHTDESNINKSKTEEKLQRDYLSNLSKQLDQEKTPPVKQSENQPHYRTHHSKNTSKFKFKRESRSKSETFLTFQSILTPNSILGAKNHSSNIFSNLNINSSSKELRNQKMLSSIIKKHGISTINSLKNTDKSSTTNNNYNHDVNTNTNINSDTNHLTPHDVESRRFSFRNYFFKTKQDSIDESSSNHNLKTSLQSPTGVSVNNFSINNQLKDVGSHFSKANLSKTTKGPKTSNAKTNKKTEPSTSISSNSHESIKINHREQISKSEFNVKKTRNILNSFEANESSTTNFPESHENPKDAAEYLNNNNSDSENSDLDKVFNEFNKHKKAKSVGRIPSLTGTAFVNNRNPRTFQNGLNIDTLAPMNKGTRTLTKSCRNILSSVFGKNKLKNKNINETNNPFLPTDNIVYNCNLMNTKTKQVPVQNSQVRRRNFFEKMRSNDKFAQNFKFSQCSSYGSDIELDNQFKKMDNPLNNAQVTNKKIDYSNPANFELQNINLSLIEKAFKKNSLLSKPTEVIYLKLNRSLMNAAKNGRRSSSISRCQSNINFSPDEITSSFAPRSNDNFLKNASNFLGFKSNKTQMFALIDVSIERVAQRYDTHVLSISLQNLKVDPLFEINHIKSKLTYVSVQLIDSNSFTEELAIKNRNLMSNASVTSNSTASPTKSMNAGTLNESPVKRTYNYLKQKKTTQKFYAKISRNKTQKCKFNANNRSFQKPVDFVLVEEHFFRVTDEAAYLQMQKKFKPSCSLINEIDTVGNQQDYEEEMMTNNLVKPSPFHKNYIFLFSIELHSYLPISRKTLSSTFRKKKRIFKGQCQIYENFVKNTQFSKKFELQEI